MSRIDGCCPRMPRLLVELPLDPGVGTEPGDLGDKRRAVRWDRAPAPLLLASPGHEDPACLPTPVILCARSFRNFDVEESHQCSLDWLLLGPAAPPRQEAFRLCGSAIPPAFISARDHVWIFFHSDASSSGQAQGFRLSYIRGDARKVLH